MSDALTRDCSKLRRTETEGRGMLRAGSTLDLSTAVILKEEAFVNFAAV